MSIGNIGDSPIPESFGNLLQYSTSTALYDVSGSLLTNLDVTPTFTITADLFPSPVDFTVSASHADFSQQTNIVSSASYGLFAISASNALNSSFSNFTSNSNNSVYTLSTSISLFVNSSSRTSTASVTPNLVPSASVVLTASIISGSNSSLRGISVSNTTASGYTISQSDVIFIRSIPNTLDLISTTDINSIGTSVIRTERFIHEPDSNPVITSSSLGFSRFVTGSKHAYQIYLPNINSTIPIFEVADNGVQFNNIETGSNAPCIVYNSYRGLANNGNPYMFFHKVFINSGSSIEYTRTSSVWVVENIGPNDSSTNWGFRFLINNQNLSSSLSNIGPLIAATSGGFTNRQTPGINTSLANGLIIRPPIGDANTAFNTSSIVNPTSHSMIIGSVVYNNNPEVHILAGSGFGIFPYGYTNSSSLISHTSSVSINSNSSSFVDMRIAANSLIFQSKSGSLNIPRGNLVINRLGAGISIKENTPSSTMGTVTITNGTGSVSTTATQTNSRIFFTRLTTGSGIISVGSRVVGSSFQVLSTVSENTSAAWFIVQPN